MSAKDLLHYIDASPTPFHAVAETARRLESHGYRRVDEADAWGLEPDDKVYVVRGGGSLAAFHVGTAPAEDAGFRLIGAHTDSPNLRVKPNPARVVLGYAQIGMEPYGGVLLHTWLDRDLSLAGRVSLEDGTTRLVDLARPLLRVPSLAIHLNREVNKSGLVIDAQEHMAPVVALTAEQPFDLRVAVAEALDGVDADDIIAWDLMAYDTQPATVCGVGGAFIHAGRLDNLASCHAAYTALVASDEAAEATRGIVLYDHEEVGSRSARGAASDFMRSTLRRLAGDRPDHYPRAIANSVLISADMAHAVHPNHADVHEPEHKPVLGGGPVIKVNVNQSYATDSTGWAAFEGWARDAGVTTQRYVVRSDLGCGSTIGPISAAALGIRTVDVGNPMLSMHSCREMAATSDVPKMIAVMSEFFGAGS